MNSIFARVPFLNSNRSMQCLLPLVIALALSTLALTGSLLAQVPQASTIAGNGTAGDSGDGGLASNAVISHPEGIAVDALGNVYFVDEYNLCVRKITASTGIITTVAGVCGSVGITGDGGQATSAELYQPLGVAVDANGNLYIAETSNQAIRKVTVSSGIITTVAGNGTPGYTGDGGPATSAEITSPYNIAVDPSGNIYFTDVTHSVIRKVTVATGIITTVAGNGTDGYSGDGGPATSAALYCPIGMAFNQAGDLYFADADNFVVRKVAAASGIITTVAGNGNGNIGNTGDGGPATSAGFSFPMGVAVDSVGNIYIDDEAGAVVRKVVVSTGIITTVAGNGTDGYSGDGEAATNAEFSYPWDIAVGTTGNIYISDSDNNRIREVTSVPAPTVFDSGTVTLTINGAPESASYNTTMNATSNAMATALETAVNADPNSPATATQSGSTLTLASKQPGVASNYAYSLSSNYDTQDFTQSSFSASPSSGSLAGGTDPSMIATHVYSYSMLPPNVGYAPNGNLAGYTDSVMGAWTFGYDGLNRLVSGTATPAYGQNSFYCWSYDSFGNRTNQSGSNQSFESIGGTPPCQPASSASLTTDIGSYSSANQILSTNANGTSVVPTYDAAGNIIDDGNNVYLYDPEGRICAVGTPAAPPLDATSMTQYLYDADGNRVAKGTISVWSCDVSSNGFTLTNQYILGPSGQQMTELDGSGNPIHTNVYANGSLMATYDNQGLHFYLTDWLGTRRAQTNYAGSLEATYQSLPFGEMPIGQSLGPAEQHFTGKERDAESGLDYFGARYYASTMGRFLSPDWSDEPDPVPYADLDNPQSLNLYTYAGNNPLIHIDADGHCWPQWLCNVFIEAKNKIFHGEFTTDTAGAKIRQLDREEERNRQEWQLEEQMKSHPPEIQYGIVFNPETALMFFQVHRPAFVPKNWVEKPTRNGKGTKFVDPGNAGNSVRLVPGNPNSSNPGQQRDYMVVMKNGQYLDANGNQVSRQSLESHIPQGTEMPSETFGPIE